ncbi:hypothetical protein LCGC14_1810950, partial [marine sediment metagenome]
MAASVADFNIWRQDTHARLDLILPHVTGKTVLDVGCSEGYFSRALATRGFKVTALDYDPRRIAITRYLSIINNRDLDYLRWAIKAQEAAGANIIDICVDEMSVYPEERIDFMRWT